MADAFELAGEQLREIADASDGTVQVGDGTQLVATYRQFEISIRFDGLERVEDGLSVRAREAFFVLIPPAFPFEHPLVVTPHVRFSGFNHVQWRRHLCLYRSSADWRPESGMYGFVKRLDAWIRDAAVNNLDPDDAPLHPPVAYPTVNRLYVAEGRYSAGCRLAVVRVRRTSRPKQSHGNRRLEGAWSRTAGPLRSRNSAA